MARVLLLLAILVLHLASPQHVIAQAPIAQTATAQSGQETAMQLVQSGRYDEARQMVRQAVTGDPNAALHMAFLEGKIRIRENRLPDAVGIFRNILATVPDYEPARRELTLALAAMGQTEGAVYHAERLVSQTDDARLREGLLAFIAANGMGKPRGVSLRFSIAPSTNKNRGTEQSEIMIGGLPFVISDASRARSGVGFNFGISAWNRWTLAEDWKARLSGRVDATLYEDGQDNDQSVGLAFHLETTVGPARISFGPETELTFYQQELTRRRTGVSANIALPLAPGRQLGLSLAHWRQSFPDSSFRDGHTTVGALAYRQILSPRTQFTTTLPFEVERTGRSHLDHDDLGLTLGLEHAWKTGLITGLTVGVQRDQYSGVFPGTSVKRLDTLTTLALSARHAKLSIGNFAPEIRYVFSRSESNVPFFTYDSHDVSIGFSSQF